ncbi:MAG: family 16 glycoside hydrolase [Fibrobacteria bacterium]
MFPSNFMYSTSFTSRIRLVTLPLAMGLMVGSLSAQPAAPPAAPFLACGQEPTGAALNDTVVSTPDADGYLSLFDGSTTKGWWQSCVTNHNGPAKWKIMPELKAIFSSKNGTAGGVLMTTKKFVNYEIVFDLWPDYGNDGGIFNRTPKEGKCFQTVLDYIGDASLGGTWGENGFGSRDYRPFKFAGNENTITIPGNGNGEPSNWTVMTKKMKETTDKNLPCPDAGCTQADWTKLWDPNDWNQIRIQFYGGTAAENRVRMKCWFRKIGAAEWVPVSYDTTLTKVIDPGFIGLQVHSGGRFTDKGNWYRNIKWTPLTDKGDRLITVTTKSMDGKIQYSDIKAGSHALVGDLTLDHEITIYDIRGSVLQTIKGKAGHFEYPFAPHVFGMLTMSIKTVKGTENRMFTRDLQ